jgi:deoxyadenosine/deoxycytidine kinase/nucleoside 2-deoxyribosyltransferase
MEGNLRPLAYCAAGPFDRDERSFAASVKAVLDDLGYETRFPQENAGSIKSNMARGMTLAEARHEVFEKNLRAVEDSDVLVFLLDGRVPDEGTCIEAGVAFGRGKRCIGLKTDASSVDPADNNLMIDGVLDYQIARDLDELRAMLAAERTVIDLRQRNGDVTVDLRSLEHPYVAISGPLGVGKTSLIEIMSRVGDWTVLPEPITENPYLSDVYSNLTDLSFRMQTFYLSQRALQHQSARHMSGPLVQERCLSEDGEVFTPAYRDHGAYDDNDLETLTTLYRSLLDQAPRPNLLVYLAAPFEVTVDRIRRRDRIGERDIDLDLIRVIYDRYERWALEQSRVPMLRVDTGALDYVNHPEPAAEVIGRIDVALTEMAVSA